MSSAGGNIQSSDPSVQTPCSSPRGRTRTSERTPLSTHPSLLLSFLHLEPFLAQDAHPERIGAFALAQHVLAGMALQTKASLFIGFQGARVVFMHTKRQAFQTELGENIPDA